MRYLITNEKTEASRDFMEALAAYRRGLMKELIVDSSVDRYDRLLEKRTAKCYGCISAVYGGGCVCIRVNGVYATTGGRKAVRGVIGCILKMKCDEESPLRFRGQLVKKRS